MDSASEVLVVGAGPTGLAAALFLTDLGHVVRVVEKRVQPSAFSRAFGVNARTLELLEPSGVTEQFLANGRPLHQLSLQRYGRELAAFDLSEVHHRYAFLCVQSQADSERLLAEALHARGVIVERGIELIDVRNERGGCQAVLATATSEETVHAAAVFAADGPSSTVRQRLGIDFPGTSYPEPWALYDVELTTSMDPDRARILLLDDGAVFVVRQESHLWRVLGNGSDLLAALPAGTQVGPIRWESRFAIENRVASTFSRGRIHLGGDAAHVHAGIGARGMNLGIEDAYAFALLHHHDQLDDYDHLRRPTVTKVVTRIARMMNLPRASTVPGRTARRFPGLVSTLAPLLAPRVQPWLLGLDHPVPHPQTA